MQYLDEVADGLAELQDAGVTILWRPFPEMTGPHNWWGVRDRDDYVSLWRHMFNYFTTTRGLNNLIWVYESHRPPHSNMPVDYYYPGDDYVDVIGHNLYDDTWDIGFNSNQLFRGYSKVYAFPQAGSGVTRDGSWDNLVMLNALASSFPRASFFGAWNSFVSGTYQSRTIAAQGTDQLEFTLRIKKKRKK